MMENFSLKLHINSLEDGNRTYTLTTSNLSLSLEEITRQLTLEDSLKEKEFGM